MTRVADKANNEELCETLAKVYPNFTLAVEIRFRRYVDVMETVNMLQRIPISFFDDKLFSHGRLLLTPRHTEEKGMVNHFLNKYNRKALTSFEDQRGLFEGKVIHFSVVQYDYELVVGNISYKFSVVTGNETRENGDVFYLGDCDHCFHCDESMPKEMQRIILAACGGEAHCDS